MRSAVWPSHSAGTGCRSPGLAASAAFASRLMTSGSVPTSLFVPCSTVIGRSVLWRSVREGMPLAGLGGQRGLRLALDDVGIGSHQLVRPLLDGDRALGVVAQRQAGDA